MKKQTAIPTVYKDVQFRSRLEARWAAFFDLCNWRWEYEPFDLDGWIPDFRITDGEVVSLAEVKPLSYDRLDAVFDSTVREIEHAVHQAESVPADSVYILGINIRSFWRLATILEADTHEYELLFKDALCSDRDFERANDAFIAERREYWRMLHEDSWLSERFRKRNSDRAIIERLESLWIHAGNSVQWKSPRRTNRSTAPQRASVDYMFRPIIQTDIFGKRIDVNSKR